MASAVDWTPSHDVVLCDAYLCTGGNLQKVVATLGRPFTIEQCAARLKTVERRGRWAPVESAALQRVVESSAENAPSWSTIALSIPGRSGKQCREKYTNSLAPGIRTDSWTPEEDGRLRALVAQHGNAWVVIATKMRGRGDNAVKNRGHALQKASHNKRDDAARGDIEDRSSRKKKKKAQRQEAPPPPPVLMLLSEMPWLPGVDGDVDPFDDEFHDIARLVAGE